MFQVEDDFDFDDDQLDIPASGSDVSSKPEDVPEIVAQNLTNRKLDLFGKVKRAKPVGNIEFLNAWEAHKENGFPQNISNTFSFSDKVELSTRHIKKTVRQRKFPGPAGLLPERQGNTSLIATEEFLDELNYENDEPPSFKEKEVLSQSSGRVFESGAWSVMMEDLGASGRSLISLMNLASLRLKLTRGYKVPFLAVIINSIDCTLPDPTLIVKDITDEMHGMLHREVWEKFNAEMTPGSVLVLKNVGVISAGTTSRRHVLNITANNLTAIYSTRQEEHVQVRKISELPIGDNSKMLQEWAQIVSTPTLTSRTSRNRSFSAESRELNNSTINLYNEPADSSTPIAVTKPSLIRRQLIKGQTNMVNRTAQNKSQPEHPFKRFKTMPFNEINPVADNRIKKQSCKPVQNNPFQVDSDTSVVDSLLDGIDTNSLFEEF